MKRIGRRIAPALAACLVLAACSSVPVSAGLSCPPAPERVLSAAEMLRYHSCLLALSPDALLKEHELVERHLQKTRNRSDRIKLAMLLALPGTEFGNLAQARQLLNAPDSDGAFPDGLGALAQLLRDAMDRQMAQDEQIQELGKKLSAEKARSNGLQDKIDSIKDLERTMIQKNTP